MQTRAYREEIEASIKRKAMADGFENQFDWNFEVCDVNEERHNLTYSRNYGKKVISPWVDGEYFFKLICDFSK